ncbi:NUDIX domain-containing protein [Nocardia wallacei]|nr:NUDIX domain-containing protein [Nocardia wallacei]
MQQAEPGEHPLAAARREAYEELGLEAEFTGGRRAATRDGRPRR